MNPARGPAAFAGVSPGERAAGAAAVRRCGDLWGRELSSCPLRGL